MISSKLKEINKQIDTKPLLFLAVMYGAIQWMPFEIFGWLQNEDGFMEWCSVAALTLAAIHAGKILKSARLSTIQRLGWIIFLLLCILFVGEEISWGERIHGYGIEAIQGINTQGETNLHNIAQFQNTYGLLHNGWAALGLCLGLGGWTKFNSPLLPSRHFTLYFLIPGLWYAWFEQCRHNGACPITVPNHQEIYEFLIAIGLYLHVRQRCKKLGLSTRFFRT